MDRVSMNVLFLRTYRKGELIAKAATGFVYEVDFQRYLVTNDHVLSGVNPQTRAVLHEGGAVPDEVELILGNASDPANPTKKKIKIVNEDGWENLWFKHPNFQKNKTDIAVLPLRDQADKSIADPMNKICETHNMYIGVGSELFIVGFPLSISVDYFPIWKRASIASEPSLKIGDEQKFFVDTATRKGMSGAPVVGRVSGGYLTADRKMNIMPQGNHGGLITQLVGVYSGRIVESEKNDAMEAQLGIVWPIHLVDEIIETIPRE